MLDKLVDNARQFATADTAIKVSLHHRNDSIILSVINIGPLLPENMAHQLFDQLVSIRSNRGEHLHLGLGLYIVRLIADFHHASINAKNLTDNSGVEFEVIFNH
jgi:K+-sensing histidine kinase KdpD